MHGNYMLADLRTTAEAALVFPLFVFVPGFVAGWLLNLLDFRRRRTLTQLLLSTPFSIAICPIVTFWLGRLGGYAAVWTGYGAVWVAFLVIVAKHWRSIRLAPSNRAERWAWVAIVLWTLFAVGSLMHLQFGDRLYYNNAAYDYCVRSAFTASLMRGIPPSNPFFAAFGPVPLRYHYFWMLMCALPAKLLGIHPLLAMYGGTIWVGWALMAMIAIFLKFFLPQSEGLGRRALLGMGLLVVTGLDLLPTAYILLTKYQLASDPEWWNEVQVTSWLDSMLWVPHYLGALVAALVGLLFANEAAKVAGRRRVALVVAAGLAFASSTGLGVYVTLVFVVFYVLWIIICIRRNQMAELATLAGMGVVAALAAAPYLALMLAGRDSDASGSFAGLYIRPFSLLILALRENGIVDARVHNLVNLAALPLNYMLELGFFFLVGCWRWARWRRSRVAMEREELAGWMLLTASLLVGSFVCSQSIASNDLGIRAMLPAQFMLLLWAVSLVDGLWFARQRLSPSRWMRDLLLATMLLGAAASAYQAVVLRTMWLMIDARSGIGQYFGGPDGHEGERTLALRRAFDAIHTQLPPDARVQTDPATLNYVAQLLFDDFPAASGQRMCGVAFGGDPDKCTPVYLAFLRLFRKPAMEDGRYIDPVCNQFSTSALVVTDQDPVWHANTWVWSRPVIYADDHVRVFRCGSAAGLTSSGSAPAGP